MSPGPEKSFDREAVLDQALIEFWRQGYSATSVSALRAATGLGAKSLYDTFGGKRELFIASLDRYGETVVPKMFDAVADRHPPREALERILTRLVKASPKPPARGCLLGVAAIEVADDTVLGATVAGYLDQIQRSLAAVVQRLPLRADAPAATALASMLMSLLQGVHLISRVDGTRRHARDAVDSALQLIDGFCE